MKPPKPAILKKLNRLICEGREIAAEAARFKLVPDDVGSAVRFKEDVVDVLLDLGAPFADLRSELAGIPATRRETDWDLNHEGEPIRKVRIDVVDPPKIKRMVRHLIIARRRLDADHGAIHEVAPPVAPKKSAQQKTHGSYSAADDKVFRLIGIEAFRNHTNTELYRRYRSQMAKLAKRKMNYESFRAACNRIRKHHGLPASEKIRKAVKLL